MATQQKGEGNYKAAAEFLKEQHAFAKSGKVKEKAREAADALDEDEAGDLEEAREAAAEGRSV